MPERVAERRSEDLVAEGQSFRRRCTAGADALRIAAQSRSAAEPDRVVGRQPGLGRDLGDDSGAPRLVREQRRVQRDGDDPRRRDEAGDLLVEPDERRAAARSGTTGLGRWSKSCSVEARLVDHDHGLGRRAVDQPQRHRRIGRVVERALALDEDPVAALLALLDQPLDGALDEVADDPVDRHAPALDHHPGLAGRDEDAPSGRRPRRPRRSSSATDILPIAQSVPTVRITCLPGSVRPADRGLHPVRRPAVVDDPRARGRGRRGELGVVADERVQAATGRRGRRRSRRGSSAANRPGACRRSARCR